MSYSAKAYFKHEELQLMEPVKGSGCSPKKAAHAPFEFDARREAEYQHWRRLQYDAAYQDADAKRQDELNNL